MSVHFIRVYGNPVPQGSKRAIISKSTGRAIVLDDRKKPLRDWRATVADAAGTYATEHPGEFPMVALPAKVVLVFFLQRPKLHYSAAGGVKASFAGFPHIVKPDFDKLTRAVMDACTGILWQDDSLVTDCQVSKRYADPGPPGVAIEIAVVSEKLAGGR